MSMHSRTLSALFVGVALSGSPALLLADEPAAPADSATTDESPAGPVQVSVDATIASKYLFQGFDYSDGKFVAQPNLALSHGSFSAVVWSNFQFDTSELNEIDMSLKYSHSFSRFSVSPGYTYLKYPNRVGWDPSQEGFVDLGFEGSLNPTLSIHYDFDAGDGVYATLGVSRAVAGSVSIATNLFYQHHYYGMTGVPTTEFKISSSFPVGLFTVSPSLSRFESAENGDFSGGFQVPASWLFSINVTPGH